MGIVGNLDGQNDEIPTGLGPLPAFNADVTQLKPDWDITMIYPNNMNTLCYWDMTSCFSTWVPPWKRPARTVALWLNPCPSKLQTSSLRAEKALASGPEWQRANTTMRSNHQEQSILSFYTLFYLQRWRTSQKSIISASLMRSTTTNTIYQTIQYRFHLEIGTETFRSRMGG